MPSTPERPDAPRSGSAHHPYCDVRAPSVTFPIHATGGLASVPWAAVSYPATGPRHLPLSTRTLATAGPSAPHKRAPPDPYLAMTGPSEVRVPGNAVVWDKRKRSNIGSQVDPMFQTAARRLPNLAPRPSSNLDHRTSRANSFRMVAIPCWMDTYLLRRDCSVEAIAFDSISAEANASLQSSVGQDRTWPDHWTHMGDSYMRPRSGRIQSGYCATTGLGIRSGLCTSLNCSATQGSHSTLGRPLFFSPIPTTESTSFGRGRIGWIASLPSIESARGAHKG